MKHPNQTLSEQIEQLVREHIEASRRSAAAAIERAFSLASAAPRLKPARTGTAASGDRRVPAEMTALGERLYEAVCSQPGETMGVLGPELGKSARELYRPMTALKGSGRVRSVGQRQATRYFPAVVRPPVSGG